MKDCADTCAGAGAEADTEGAGVAGEVCDERGACADNGVSCACVWAGADAGIAAEGSFAEVAEEDSEACP